MAENLRDRIQSIVDAIAPEILDKTKNVSSISKAEAEQGWQLLTEAAVQGEMDLFEQLVAEDQAQLSQPKQNDFAVSWLMMAAFSGQTEVVRMLLNAGATPHFKQAYLFTEFDALSFAADKSHQEIVHLLVAAGADPNALNEISRPLTTAVQKGRVDIAQLLIELGADPHARGLLCNNTLLIAAADKGQTEIVRLLLESGVDLHIENNFHDTALDVACAKGYVEITRVLIAAGAQVNRLGQDQVPPIVVAAASPDRLRFLKKQGFLEPTETLDDIDERATQIIHALLKAGADPDFKSGSGTTALLVAVSQGATEIIKALLAAKADINLPNEKKKARNTPLVTAIETEHSEIAQLLLQAGANPHQQNGYGIAPIDLANNKGLTKVVQQLQAQGAMPNTESATTASLMGAVRRGDLAAVNQAIHAGVDLNGDDREFPKGGLTALMYAALSGDIKIVEALTAAGVDVNCHDSRQLPWHKTALMYAVETNQLEIVQHLLQLGAAPNASDRITQLGRTALMYAAIQEHVEIVRVLLDAGASATLKDRKGETALNYAYSNFAIVELLLAAGADPYEIGAEDTPLESAALMGHEKIVQLMLQKHPSHSKQAQVAKAQALDWAASNGDDSSIQELRQAGADINASSEDGSTPLITAVIHGSIEAIKYLVNAGADLTVTDDSGQNSLLHAIDRGHFDIARWLLQVGAILPKATSDILMLKRVFQQNEWWTSQQIQDAVQILLAAGIDVNARNEDGETALAMAVTHQLTEIVKMLIDAGAALDKDGRALLAQAIADDSPEIAAILKANMWD